MNEPRLIFFDIDATLITTGGVGKSAMHDAGRALHGPDFKIDGISFAGRLDPLRPLERFRAKRIPVRVKKTRQNKELEPRF